MATASAQFPANTVNLNVFAVVSDNIEHAVIDLSHDLKVHTGCESFPLKGYQTHCTLYMTRYDRKSIDKIVEKVKEIAESENSFEFVTGGVHLTKGNWLFLNMQKNNGLQYLADRLATELSPLRQEDDHIPAWVEQYPEKKKNIAEFGSPNVFAQFEPHLTLLAGGDDTFSLCRFVVRSVSRPYGRAIKGRIVGIGIGEAPHFGQIKKADHVFLFKK